ncbi:myosin light chain kinase, smooth muscle-like [Limulus polyphemus]|uniref:Myosin light chain kinase, smooth muscle-like n=1 Tax=Limulus polyphemus TaxID=6850 RepID=A0ABM1SV22_LIMPO|nr:myosin light chain kinase, smooth muscle-like [Limulus polyphemus]XP_022247477.1 myosin light chain kinase, smooth muscle-like [Limulus polyphemus]XP_022247478.1 myosin light chain kinase, smooth muscle-like [Limulus polyphemus]XP_022247479.1 myosin light chain kinase, smooth muscle-like [Limulus polyphemus]
MIYIDETEPDHEEFEPVFEQRNVTVKQDKDVKEEYNLYEELGRGKFGTVYKCEEKASGRVLAAKFITTNRAVDRKDVEREVEIMRVLQHPRLLQLYDAFDDGKKQMCIILELIEGGELFERVIDDDFVLTEKVCAIFMKQICEGIGYMHSQNILHLDMKPENVLCLSKTGNRIKLIDFGLAIKFDPLKKIQILFGTPEFVSPEVVNFDRVSYGTDMWSVGVICYTLLSGLSPFMGDSVLETMANVTKAAFDFNDESFEPITDEAKDFICQLLVKDRTERMSATNCLHHPWLREDKKKEVAQLNKTKLKKFVTRRRWQKAVNTILALKRMGAVIVP